MKFKQNSARGLWALGAMTLAVTDGELAFAKSAEKPPEAMSARASTKRNKSGEIRPTEGVAASTKTNKSGTIPIDPSVAPTAERNIHQYPGGGHAVASVGAAAPEVTEQSKPKVEIKDATNVPMR